MSLYKVAVKLLRNAYSSLLTPPQDGHGAPVLLAENRAVGAVKKRFAEEAWQERQTVRASDENIFGVRQMHEAVGEVDKRLRGGLPKRQHLDAEAARLGEL